jgi:dTDP-glucose 4,6-dehydratase
LGALHPTRDFSYVADTVDGFIAALESDQGIGEVINLGSGFEISIGDTLNLIAELMDVQVQAEEEAVRFRPANSEVNRLLADNSKAIRLLGWQPSYSKVDGFRRGLTETIQWFTDPGNLNVYKPDRYTL